MSISTTKFWRKTFPVDAVRLTLDNYKQIADYLGWDYREGATGPYIIENDHPLASEAGIGDWLVKGESRDMYLVYNDEDFLAAFRTDTERMAEDEQYAKVHELVMGAMRKQDAATYHGESNGMDLVAHETTKRILREL